MKELAIDWSGVALKACLYEPRIDVSKPALLFLHGWTGTSNESAAAVLAEQGYQVMTFNFPGHNGSGGDISTLTSH